MGTNQKNDPKSHSEAQIGALLDRVEDATSIVDQLMAIPAPQATNSSEAPEWDAAVNRRLQDRLVDAMRGVIEGEPEKKRA